MDQKNAIIFPGQGSQTVGMGYEIYQEFSSARIVAQKVDDLLGYSLSDLMFYGPDEDLRKTRFAQLAIFTTSLMILSVIEDYFDKDLSEIVSYAAGHSVGEYAALVAAQILSLEDSIDLLKARAQAMDEASPRSADGQPLGGMCAILGLEKGQVMRIIDEEVGTNSRLCSLANDNCPGQIVVTGTREGVERVRERALREGAKRGVMLAVSGPFHSCWMKPAEAVLCEKIANVSLQQGRFPVVSNVTAQPILNVDEWKDLLPRQVTHPVRWRETMEGLTRRGIHTFWEIGHGQVLSQLGRRCSSTSTFVSLQSPDDIRQVGYILSS